MATKPVSIDLSESDIAALLTTIAVQQERSVGVRFGYCMCGAAITARACYYAKKVGRVAQCRPCYMRRKAKDLANLSATKPLALCCICRKELSGDAAYRARNRHGYASCGADKCRAEARILADSHRPSGQR